MGGNAITKDTWIIVDSADLKVSPSNLLSCKLAESLGIISFHNPQTKIYTVAAQIMKLQKLQYQVTLDVASIDC